VLFVPFVLVVAVLVALASADGRLTPPEAAGTTGLLALVVAAALGGAAVWIPGVRAQQHLLVRSLLRGPLADEPVHPSGPAPVREAVWLASHLLVGFGVAIGTMIVLTEAALLALRPL